MVSDYNLPDITIIFRFEKTTNAKIVKRWESHIPEYGLWTKHAQNKNAYNQAIPHLDVTK
jgi:hypothetical protein